MNILLIFPGFIIAFIIVLYYERKIRRTEPMNKVHFYVARDKDGGLYLYFGKPFRGNSIFMSLTTSNTRLIGNKLKNYGLKQSDYDNLKWEDEPVEVFLNLED